MRALIVSDSAKTTGDLHSILSMHGIEYHPNNDVLPIQAVLRGVKQIGQDLVLLAMPLDFQLGLRAVKQLRGATRGTIVVIGPTRDSKALLTVLREGANEYLDVDDLAAEFAATIGRIQFHRHEEKRGRVISLIGACGGVGTSSIAVNLAAAFTDQDVDCGLVDLRLGLGDLSLLLDVEPKHSLATVCRNTSRLDHSLFRHSLAAHSSGIQLLPAPCGWDECEHVTAKGVRHAITMCRSTLPTTVLDLDSSFTAEQVAALVSSDVILLVARPDMLSLKNGRRILATLDRLGISERRTRLIINHNGQRGQLPLVKVQQAFGIEMLQAIPEEVKYMNLASNRGVPIVLEHPRNKVSKTIIKLRSQLELLPAVYDRLPKTLNGTATLHQTVASPSKTQNVANQRVVADSNNKPDNKKGSDENELDTPSIEFSL